ncbi:MULTISPECIES: ABC transporter ATP-binding protein [unclassified Chelatococcus]|uniref:ABC transporter ATP-binding protein n=1 Tax=unclassified Chelatococcus TaxID=2638111 RepID=UPI001BD1A477|nr:MULTISPECIES: ABC transporter ATP-binding protein [unclassified Chelatococcus]MBS7701507.1 ABC transporter ATP-binding protein [Chelatococcus sp. YT9]MBX3556882.1 ABC transporter ATP-binding protein [Chelatococcus sp.]
MSESLLTTRGLAHGWSPDHWLFRDLDLTIGQGEVLSILGPNGRGKTTLMRAIAGLQETRAGTVTLTSGASVAYIPQSSRGTLAYRVIDMVVMGRAPHLGILSWPGKRDHAIAHAALERVGAAHLADHPFKQLSGGERQLVLLARALASEAQLLLLDEPMAALDLKNQNAMLNVLAHLVRDRGVAVIVTTHHPQHALTLGGKALILGPPGQHVVGDARSILTDERLTALYGLAVARVDVEHKGLRARAVVPMFEAGATA